MAEICSDVFSFTPQQWAGVSSTSKMRHSYLQPLVGLCFGDLGTFVLVFLPLGWEKPKHFSYCVKKKPEPRLQRLN